MCLLIHSPVKVEGFNKIIILFLASQKCGAFLMQLLEVISPYEKCRMGIKSKGEVTRMENIYEVVGFSVIWGGAGALIGTFVGALEQALKERKKAKLAKKIGIKRYI